ncbi:hypothetical protein D3C73_1161490 [compost metagenome]
MQAPDPLQRHVEGARRTGRRQAVAIHYIGFAGDLAEPGDFRQRRTMLRVNGAAIAVEQTGLAEKPGAIPDPGQRHALLGRALQEAGQPVVGLERGAVATADNQQIQRLNFDRVKARIGSNHQAQIADDFPFGQAEGFR